MKITSCQKSEEYFHFTNREMTQNLLSFHKSRKGISLQPFALIVRIIFVCAGQQGSGT
jgi:hypothetical protein